MSEAELVKEVSKSLAMKQSDIKEVLDRIKKVTLEKVVAGEEVQLHGFGKFYLTKSPSRKGRNPVTGEEVQIDESQVLRFRAFSQAKTFIKEAAAGNGKKKTKKSS